jgi:type II secretory ATPase GspE/PulE/Tfp pilus assembly ATPase PilB-like protein
MENPYVVAGLADFEPLPQGGDQYTESFTRKNEALVLRADGQSVVVGLTDPDNAAVRRSLEQYHRAHAPKASVRFVRIERNELLLHLGRRNRNGDLARNAPADTPPDDGVYLDRIANDAPIVNLVNSLVLQAWNDGASDIHFDAQEHGMQVRFRVDGVLLPVETIRRDWQMAVASRIKVMAQLNIMERRLPQDGRCAVQLDNRTYDIRVSIIPSIHGESIVLRLLPGDGGKADLGTLGFSPADAQRLRDMLGRPHGLFLATGPTGSGKTTTLHALLRGLPVDTLKIITLEDPVEYQLAGITQVQTNEAIGLGFDACLRRVLRQDPDVIMVGEIRDHATAELAVRASLTGHLVVSSLHTNTALDAVVRLVDLGVEPYLLGAVLRGVLGQRLVRKLCPKCRSLREAPDAERPLLSAIGLESTESWYPVGCRECRGTGYAGRTLCYELILPDRAFLERIATDPTALSPQDCLGLAGHVPLYRHAAALLDHGVTSIAEIARVVYS